MKFELILWYRLGEGQWQQRNLDIGEIVVGRGRDCDLQLNDDRVSRQHAKLKVEPDGSTYIVDLGSSNGTRIEGERIGASTTKKIKIGQIFTMGNYIFTLLSPQLEEDLIPTAPAEAQSEQPVMNLYYQKGGGSRRKVEFSDELTIGRSSSCGLQIEDNEASRQHARVTIKDGVIWLEDMGSSNGTLIDQQRITAHIPQQLDPGKQFRISDYVFYVTEVGEGEPLHKVKKPVRQQAAIPAPPPMPPPMPPPIGRQAPVPSYKPKPPRKKKGLGCITTLGLLSLGLFSCVCVVAGGLWFWMSSSGETVTSQDLAATQVAVQATELAWQVTQAAVPIEQPPTPQPVEQVPTPLPAVEPTSDMAKQSWLIMLYQDADDDVLEEDVYLDLNEAEVVGSTDRVRVVSQFDRYQGAYSGDGDWVSTKRFYLNQDGNMEVVASQELADMGEMNMGDGNTLADFLIWGITNYPSDKYVLIMSDHGTGWLGGWSDQDPSIDDDIYVYELDQVLNYVISQTGIGQFELVGFDACLMAQLEVFSALTPYARYSVASEEVEPTMGWAYAHFLNELVNNPDMDGSTLASSIVAGYIENDLRILDEGARTSWLQSLGVDVNYPVDQIIYEMSLDVTLSAVDLSALQEVNTALNDFSQALQYVDQSAVARARTYAQYYENPFGEGVPPSFLDLGHFAMMAAEESGSAEVRAAADNLVNAIARTVIAEKHGPERSASTGIAIFFPNSEVYTATYDDSYGYAYTAHANRFAGVSLWDDFLAFHYYGLPISP